MTLPDDLDRAATRLATPCGEGVLVWRVWNGGAGNPLVLLHGGNGSWRHWVRQIPHFAATRCVIAPDLPGLGDSALPPEPQDPPQAASALLDGWRDVVGRARADLVGFSHGANVAGQVAARMGEALRTLTIVGAGSLGVARNAVPLEKVRDKAGEARIAAHRFNLASLMIADPARIDDLAIAIQEWNTVHARFRSRGFANAALLKEALARTTAPLTAIWGERDQIALGQLPLRCAAVREARPDAAFALIPGAGHWVAYEAPEAFNAALEGALCRAG
jgi:pimeloyl-ACP methyl ester carboxylesterase